MRKDWGLNNVLSDDDVKRMYLHLTPLTSTRLLKVYIFDEDDEDYRGILVMVVEIDDINNWWLNKEINNIHKGVNTSEDSSIGNVRWRVEDFNDLLGDDINIHEERNDHFTIETYKLFLMCVIQVDNVELKMGTILQVNEL